MNVLIKISTIIITLTIGVFLSSQLVLAQGSILTEEKNICFDLELYIL